MRAFLPLACLVLVGCGSHSELMPMEVGRHWSYSVSANFKTYTTDVRCVRRTGVADVEGYVLSGPMGESRLAWKGGQLVADHLVNTRFEPAIPLVVDTEARVRRTWSGQASGLWGHAAGTAVLDQGPGEELIAGRAIKTTKSVLTLTTPKATVRVQTMFQPGGGILTQREWVNGNLVLSLERLSGS